MSFCVADRKAIPSLRFLWAEQHRGWCKWPRQKLEQVFPYQIKRVQTDNGSEFHQYFKDYLKEKEITHYWNYPLRPFLNGHIEKYNRTIQDEFIDQHSTLLEDTKKFNHRLMDYLIWYNTKRSHWSLKLLSPVDYLIKITI